MEINATRKPDNFLKKSTAKVRDFAENKALSCGLTVSTVGYMMSTTLAFADAASSLMETTIGILCKLIIVLGVLLVIMGAIGWASAHSEGDGPAQQKATMKIAAGIMLAVLSIVLDNQKSAFVSIITT